MRIFKYLAACSAAAILFCIAATPANAQEPHYLRALKELRTARDYIQFDHRPALQSQLGAAVDEINKAIAEIKRAAWDDGKVSGFTPPPGMVEASFALRRAQGALEAANQHTKDAIDRPENRGLQARAINHIEQAETILGRVLRYEQP